MGSLLVKLQVTQGTFDVSAVEPVFVDRCQPVLTGTHNARFSIFQKLIKNLPLFDEADRTREASLDSDASSLDENNASANGSTMKQDGGDATVESVSGKRPRQSANQIQRPSSRNQNLPDPSAPTLGQKTDEIAFFKFLHAELKKAEFFFRQTTREFQIREERMKTGLEVIKATPRGSMVDQWRTMSKAMYSLYRDLLLLETFAIMTYVGFSKILKKHDKVTGYRTCNAYMESVVNGANFTHYPEVMSMISSCEMLYEEISEALKDEGIKALSEDEKLFISMIQRVSGEVLGDDKINGSAHRSSFVLQRVRAESKSVDDLRELLAADSNDADGGSHDGEPLEKPPARKVAKR
jgi:hypothetical protein